MGPYNLQYGLKYNSYILKSYCKIINQMKFTTNMMGYKEVNKLAYSKNSLL